MIEQATAFNTAPREDAGYKSWQTSVHKAVMRLDPQGRTAGPIPTFGSMVHETAMAAHGIANAYAPAAPASIGNEIPDIAYDTKESSDEYSFSDVIDIVNPLQHLPVIGTIYRKITGDTIKGMSTILGGALFGGPIGFVGSTANVIIKDRTGKDIAENALSFAGIETAQTPAKNNDIVYTDAEPAYKNNLAATNLYEKASNDGRKNFSAAKTSAMSWNA